MRKTIALNLESDPNFTVFLSIIKLSGLYAVLDGDDKYTLFAPDNEAFERLTAPVYARLINEDRKKLRRIMEYHIVPGEYKLDDLSHNSRLQTLNGNDIIITTVNDKQTRINESNIIRGNKWASNGVIHVIDAVL